ncbi:hypothetical protein NM208_g6531 [Fusarium decemcellulare]|uniref:Uncharacterized protein n=1 Tax=Fusarium decemcellulare TaxID=57161 RepID=A0ACC1SCZ1_9HYPO|nr:hypothetical protein NM208_g6531 [Fusarium decemcellulare]
MEKTSQASKASVVSGADPRELASQQQEQERARVLEETILKDLESNFREECLDIFVNGGSHTSPSISASALKDEVDAASEAADPSTLQQSHSAMRDRPPSDDPEPSVSGDLGLDPAIVTRSPEKGKSYR